MSHGFRDAEDALHEAAVKAAGYDDFGDDSYLEGLRMVLQAYDDAPKLTKLGCKLTMGQLTRCLINRLQTQQGLAADPGVLDHEIRRPIVILGLVRTGSTALHHLIGQDPGLQPLEFWLAAAPQKRPPRSEWAEHPDFKRAEAEIEMIYSRDESLKTVHSMLADGPEECRHLLAQQFTDDSFLVNATIPSYTAWYETVDMEPTYRRHRDAIKLIGATSPDKRWLLKYPVHMRYVGDLLKVYPDACIVQTHRDPASVLSSYSSLIAKFRAAYESELDREEITRSQVELWASAAERAIAVRQHHDPAQFFDLFFEDFNADPLGSVKRIYAHFDQELSDEGERRLEQWAESHRRHSRGKHDYKPADRGVPDQEIWDRFAGYMDHFGMKPGR